jgi:hypothetical protein
MLNSLKISNRSDFQHASDDGKESEIEKVFSVSPQVKREYVRIQCLKGENKKCQFLLHLEHTIVP